MWTLTKQHMQRIKTDAIAPPARDQFKQAQEVAKITDTPILR